MIYIIIDIIGLGLSVAGAIMLCLFNLLPRVTENGEILWYGLEKIKKEEIKKPTRLKMLTRKSGIGLILLALGFSFQLLGRLIPLIVERCC